MLQKSEQLLMLRSDTTTSLPSTTSVGTPTKRHSRASDTSSAYSGSDMTTQSLSVVGDDADIDLSCLRESSVDSDDDENLDATEVTSSVGSWYCAVAMTCFRVLLLLPYTGLDRFRALKVQSKLVRLGGGGMYALLTVVGGIVFHV